MIYVDLTDDNIEENISADKKILQKLIEMNVLHYGKLIDENEIKEILELDPLQCSYKDWELSKLRLREIVKDAGYFITSRNRENDLYILEPHEMAAFNERKNKSQFKNLQQRQRGLHMIAKGMLTKEQEKKLEFEILKNARFELEMANELNKRCRY